MILHNFLQRARKAGRQAGLRGPSDGSGREYSSKKQCSSSVCMAVRYDGIVFHIIAVQPTRHCAIFAMSFIIFDYGLAGSMNRGIGWTGGVHDDYRITVGLLLLSHTLYLHTYTPVTCLPPSLSQHRIASVVFLSLDHLRPNSLVIHFSLGSHNSLGKALSFFLSFSFSFTHPSTLHFNHLVHTPPSWQLLLPRLRE